MSGWISILNVIGWIGDDRWERWAPLPATTSKRKLSFLCIAVGVNHKNMLQKTIICL